ncbi:MAG: type II secretion system protein [Phycisphaerae bacterium]|nr:type II secretion system protein [Phycisphaerae bacterium]
MTNGSCLRRAFTLIEVMAVVAIISLLLALMIPALSAARAAMDASTCQSNMRQIALGLTAYGTEFGALPGNARDTTGDLQWMTITGGPALADQRLGGLLLAKNLEMNPKVFICPTFKNQPDLGGDKVICHYAIPSFLSCMPLGNIRSGCYKDASGLHNLDGVPTVVEPTPATLGTYNTTTSTWTTMPNGVFEQFDAADAHRHSGKVHFAFHNSTMRAVDSTADIAAETIYVRRSSDGWYHNLGGVNNTGATWSSASGWSATAP